MAIKLNARSPYFLRAADANLDNATVNLYIYTGEKYVDKPSSPQYILSKEVLGVNTYVAFEIGELVRDYIDSEFSELGGDDFEVLYRARVVDDGGTFVDSPCLDSYFNQLTEPKYRGQNVWVEATILEYSEAGGLLNTTEYLFIGFDGYSYFTDGANSELSRTLLQSNTDMYILSGERVQIPVFNEGVHYCDFLKDGVSLGIQYATDSDFSNKQTLYLGENQEVDTIRIYDNTVTNVATVKVYTIEECKYTPYKVTFINKFGVLQDIWFFKKSMEQISTESKEYKASVFDSFLLSYDTSKHQYKQFHKMGKQSITMNTGFVSEQYNEVLKELLLSEAVWMTKEVDSQEVVIPIKPKTESLTYKTRINDKLINYSIEFENAFDEINNIR